MTNEPFDFGFSLVDEQELRSRENQLDAEVVRTTDELKSVAKTMAMYSAALDTVVDMIAPLLNNLSQKPDKSYIYWPNRVEKIAEFKKQLETYVEKIKHGP